jgi:hypothetical protein
LANFFERRLFLSLIEVEFLEVNQAEEEESGTSDCLSNNHGNFKLDHQICKELGTTHDLSATLREIFRLNMSMGRRGLVVALVILTRLRNQMVLGQCPLGVRGYAHHLLE